MGNGELGRGEHLQEFEGFERFGDAEGVAAGASKSFRISADTESVRIRLEDAQHFRGLRLGDYLTIIGDERLEIDFDPNATVHGK